MNFQIGLDYKELDNLEKYKDFNLNHNADFDDVLLDDIEPVFNNFCLDPQNTENINALIEVSTHQPFPIPPYFLSFIAELLNNNINSNECICLLGIIIHFPIEYYIDFFPTAKIVKTLYNFIETSSNVIPILTFFLQNAAFFSHIDEIFLKFEVIQKVGELLDSTDQMKIIQALTFFRYLLKTNLPFLDDIIDIYYKILSITINSLNTFSIHTLYHFTKKYIEFKTYINQNKKDNQNNEDTNNNNNHHRKRHSLAKKLIFPELFLIPSQSKINDEVFLLYLMKFYYTTSKIKKIFRYNSEMITDILPLIFSCLQITNQKIIDYSLLFIYNILRDGRRNAYNIIMSVNPDLMTFLLQNYEKYAFFAQKEIIFIFIEYSYYMSADELSNIFEEFNIADIFSEIGLAGDEELLEDFCLCFLNIYDTFVQYNPDYLKYFQSENFVNMILSLDPESSTRYRKFYQKLMSILPQETYQ